jgi:hypothetical protein
MKKILILSFALGTLNISSQTSIAMFHKHTTNQIAPGAVLTTMASPGDLLTVTVDIKNIGSVKNSYDVKRYDILINKAGPGDTAVAYFCFGGQCYDSGTMKSALSLELDPGQSSVVSQTESYSLDADFTEATVKGLSYIKYTFYNTNNVNDSVQFSLRYNDPAAVAVKEQSKKITRFDIYPNPAKDVTAISVQSSFSQVSTLTIFNSIGELVIEKEMPLAEGKNSIAVNVQGLSAGIYIAQLKEGSSVTSKKLIIE